MADKGLIYMVKSIGPRKFKYTSFFHLIKYKIAIFMYKVYHKMLPLTVLKLFTHYYSHYLTRHSFTFL